MLIYENFQAYARLSTLILNSCYILQVVSQLY